MQDISIRLFEGAYTFKPRAEQRMMLLALAAMVLQMSLLLYLIIFKTFATGLVVILLLSLLVPAYFISSVWLDKRPQYRRHLTLSAAGVRYRTRFLQAEHEFDWEEIDLIKIELFKVNFVLKNEEVHEVNLHGIQNDRVLHEVKEQILQYARLKSIDLN